MRYLRQAAIILAVTFAGELLHYYIPLPVPASIYGLLLLLGLLCSGILRPEHVQDAARMLISWMPLMFVAPIAALLPVWDRLAPILLAVAVISVLSTILTMAVTGRTAQAIMHLEAKKKK